MELPLVSIIMPVYNRERILIETINELLNMKFADYELLLVNDASTDRSAEICDSFASEYSHIKAIHQLKNGGPGLARNKGMELATGQFIFFMDSDDKIDNTVFDKIAERLRANPQIDILTLNHKEITPQGTHEVRIVEHDKEYDADDLLSDKAALLHLAVWRSLFNHSFLKNNNLTFFDIKTHEDICFNSLAFLSAKTIHTMPDIFYFYYRHFSENSLVDTFTVQENYKGIEFCSKQMDLFIQKNAISEAKQRAVDHFIYASTLSLIDKMSLDEIADYKFFSSDVEFETFTVNLSLYRQYGMLGCAAYVWGFIRKQVQLQSEQLGKDIYFCPAGKLSVSFAQRITNKGSQIVGILDNNCRLDNFHIVEAQKANSIHVYPFSQLEKYKKPEDYFIIVLGSMNTARAISRQLDQLGLVKNINYVSGV
ncbi:hypothetical protein B1748_18510 [Paenibacillus sp. MY03]|uniref:glycosyltransferase family 2 protein n=1 Tax=Paenibacillus sp. MY03 TaxID=302980 RepID=UPI000B3CE4FC|nr:glycosyltransferase [Paenibacillus sp. MY03]OUS75132.1 hypothetical protein B1748_18510 [Paenibacillus sp. MY03]